MYIVIHGSPLVGWTFFGPFKSVQETEEWMMKNVGDKLMGNNSLQTGWYASLKKP